MGSEGLRDYEEGYREKSEVGKTSTATHRNVSAGQ